MNLAIDNLEQNNIKLIHGDCLEVMKTIPDESIDLVVTDPPYLINYRSHWTSHSKPISGDNRVLKPDSAAYIFCSPKRIDYFMGCCKDSRFTIKNNIVWVKNNWSSGDLKASYGQKYEIILLLNKGRKCFNGKRLTDIWFFDRVAFQHQYHPNEKPVRLLEQCIIKHSNESDIVLDPFMGSGSTGIACIHTDRQFLGIEKDMDYFLIAEQRIDLEQP